MTTKLERLQAQVQKANDRYFAVRVQDQLRLAIKQCGALQFDAAADTVNKALTMLAARNEAVE